ncbi:30976_t:CDS:1, partial [Racocetra persica]
AKATDFCVFIENINLPDQQKYFLLLDNARIHHAKQACINAGLFPIKEVLTSKNIMPIFLVAYTPQLNPVELCFNFLRSHVEKHKPRTFEELKYIIEQGIEKLQGEDMTEYFRHCLNYDFSKTEQGFCNL